MKGRKQGWILMPFGLLFLVLGLFNLTFDLIQRAEYSHALSLGGIPGDVAYIAVGIFAAVTSKGLRTLEERMTRIENDRVPSSVTHHPTDG